MMAILLPFGLAFIMFSLGLGLALSDFRRVFRRPLVVVAGLFAQVVALPLTAWAIAGSLGLDENAAIGLMILAACPGGVTAGMVTRLAGGDTALSISLTALTSLLAFITVPLIVGASMMFFSGQAEEDLPVPVGQLVGGLFLVTLIPVMLGLWLNERGIISKGNRQLVHRLATAVFVAIVLATFASQWSVLIDNLVRLGAAALLLNISTMTTGAILGLVLGIGMASRVALAMECGMQNAALGITLAVTLLADPSLAVPSVVYALLMNVTAFAVIGWRYSGHRNVALEQSV
jgi:BASS family bile acid:Na+ symporter